MKRPMFVSILLALSFVAPLKPQPHPRMFLTPELLSTIKSRAAANTIEWQRLVGTVAFQNDNCTRLTTPTAGTTDGLPPVYAPRQPLAGSHPVIITASYQGEGYNQALVNLAACYLAVNDTNPIAGAKYLTQAKKIMSAMTAPFATVAGASGTRVIYYVSNEGNQGQARVNLVRHGFKAGEQVEVKGSLGCAAANGISVVAEPITATYFHLNAKDGKPVVCEGLGKNYNANFLSDAGYGIRNYLPPLSIAYDWLYQKLDEPLKTQIYMTVNGMISEWKAMRFTHEVRPQSNYHVAYYAALGLSGIAMYGENPKAQEFYKEWRDVVHFQRDQPFFNRWLSNSAGFPEAWTYMNLGSLNVGMPLLANLTAFNENLFEGVAADGSHLPAFPWFQQQMKYFVHITTPDRLHMLDRGYVAFPSEPGADVSRWSPAAMYLSHYIGDLVKDPFAPKFKRYVEEILPSYLQLKGVPGVGTYSGALWVPFLFWDAEAPGEEWRDEKPSQAMMSNPSGGYGHIVMRSGWESDSVIGSFYVSPFTSDFDNGKERYDKGSLLIRRGQKHFLVNPMAESARAENLKAWNYFADPGGMLGTLEHQAYSVYYVARPSMVITQTAVGQPGADLYVNGKVTTEFPTRIDLYEDSDKFVYSRGISIDKTYRVDWGASSGHSPVAGWTREIVYVRPNRFVVYDRTVKKNKLVTPELIYEQYLSWAVGATPKAGTPPSSEMKRIDVSDEDGYKGAITVVLPENAGAEIVDLSSFGAVYQVKVTPPTEEEAVNWLTVLDAADSVEAVGDVERLSGSGVDAVRLNGSDVVGFVNGGGSLSYAFTPKANGTHVIAGLTPGGKYTVERTTLADGQIRISIAANEAGAFQASTDAGVLNFDGDSPTPKAASSSCSVTASPLSQSILASGGNAEVTVAAEAGCAWTLSVPPSWMAASTSLSGSGNGKVVLAVSANNGGLRSAALSIGGKTVTIQQQAAATSCSYTLAPASLSSVAAGGTQNVGVTTDSACTWTAFSSLSWATIVAPAASTGAKGTGLAQVKFAANTGAARSGTITVAGKTVAVSQAAAACSYAVTPTSLSAAVGGSTLSVMVTAAAGCSWTASSSLNWVTFPTGSSGTGSGILQIKVAANTGAGRSGTIMVAGKTVTINQPTAACTFSVSPTSLSSSSGGGVVSISVSTSTGCSWTASSGLSWAMISSGSTGSGSGTVQVKVAANTGVSRTGTITVAGKTVTISQADGACSYSVTPTSASISKAGGTLSFQVTATTGCSWTAKSAVSWAVISAGAGPQSGNGTVKATVATNTSGVARKGYLAITNKLVTVSQSAQ